MNEQNPRSEELIGLLLRHRGATVVTAESCTGGLIGNLLTNVSGSSDYFLGGVIAYSNEVKRNVLGVREETLATLGAVSAETAIEMAHGARRLLGADYVLSVTGIAGPAGGTAEKPVGLVYIAMVGPDVERCDRRVWQQDRLGNKRQSAEYALQMLIEHLAERT
jgi:PncC family amidohydrolase